MHSNNKLLYPIELDVRQIIKFSVYLLLIVNYVYYFIDEWEVAKYTLVHGGTFLEWTSAFRTSIDETAWFVLLIIFELETYALTDAAFTPARVKLMHAIRIVCYLFLAHTIYANAISVIAMHNELPAAIVNLCELADKNVSFSRNYAYTLIDSNNCHSILAGSDYYFVGTEAVVTDRAGLDLEQYMSWLDLFESMSWIAIVLCIELIMRLHEKGISGGKRIHILNTAKLVFYCLLWVAIGHWIYLGHYVYAWDEFVWIVGFAAIELNVSDWREELKNDGLNSDAATQGK